MPEYTPPRDWSETEIELIEYSAPRDWSETEIQLQPKTAVESLTSSTVDHDTVTSSIEEKVLLTSSTVDHDTVTSSIEEKVLLTSSTVDHDTVTSSVTVTTTAESLTSSTVDHDTVTSSVTVTIQIVADINDYEMISAKIEVVEIIAKPKTASEAQEITGVYVDTPSTEGDVKAREAEDVIIVGAPGTKSSDEEVNEDVKDYPTTTSEYKEKGILNTVEPKITTQSRDDEF